MAIILVTIGGYLLVDILLMDIGGYEWLLY